MNREGTLLHEHPHIVFNRHNRENARGLRFSLKAGFKNGLAVLELMGTVNSPCAKLVFIRCGSNTQIVALVHLLLVELRR